jgi:hypothetical protein
MDKVKHYREIIERLLKPFADRTYSNADIQNEVVIDTEHDHYLVMQNGWQKVKVKRIHGCLIHLDIIDGKVWIQRDGTEEGIVYQLEEAGIPKSDIVAGFHPAEDRPLTGYAVA